MFEYSIKLTTAAIDYATTCSLLILRNIIDI